MQVVKRVDPKSYPNISMFPKKYKIRELHSYIKYDYPIWLFKRPADYAGPLGIVKVPAKRVEYLLGLKARGHRGSVCDEPLLAQSLKVGRNSFKPIEDVVLPVFILKSNSTLKIYKDSLPTKASNKINKMRNILAHTPDFKPRKKYKPRQKKPKQGGLQSQPLEQKDKSNE